MTTICRPGPGHLDHAIAIRWRSGDAHMSVASKTQPHSPTGASLAPSAYHGRRPGKALCLPAVDGVETFEVKIEDDDIYILIED